MSASHFILGTAGHVDHGKTALVQALTGVNTDRLPEEQLRGISIELGFAELPLSADLVLGVVDVPGHERFVKQMVAGAGGVDLAMLVVAADEGVMPQTIEHLEILVSLGVKGGVLALTKRDLVDADIAAVAAAELQDLVRGTFLADKPLVAVSAVNGAGLDDLRAALRAEAAALPSRERTGSFRLPVDRVFTLPGAGVVVTGTCWSGQVTAGDHLVLQPGGARVRVREVQAHSSVVTTGGSGQRLALALHGVKREDVERGDQIVSAGSAEASSRLDVRIRLVDHYQGSLKSRQRLHVHHAGREVLGRVTLLDASELGGDSDQRSALAQLDLEAPLVALPGDRFVLRFYSPVTTMAGGTVLGAAAPRRKRNDPDALAELAVRERGDPAAILRQALRAAGTAGLPRAEAEGVDTTRLGVAAVLDRLYDLEVLTQVAARIGELVADYARRYPLRLGIPKEEAKKRIAFAGGRNEWNALCEVMAGLAGWVVSGDRIAAGPEGPPLRPELREPLTRREAALRNLGLQWPGLASFREGAGLTSAPGVGEEEFLKHLVDHGRAVQAGSDYYVHAEAFAGLLAALREHFEREAELSFARFRELSGLTRKLGIPLLEFLDQSGITRRAGDSRLPGPRLPKE